MRFTTFKVGEKEYKLRAAASQIVDLEKKLGGRNPLSILMAVEGGELPSVTQVLLILHASMQKFHHGMTFEKVLDLYDDYVEEGYSYTDLIPVMVDVFKTSGFFPRMAETTETATEEN